MQVASAPLRYRPGEVETSIGVLRALASGDDRAPVPALHLGLALLWAGQRAEATAELEQTRTSTPTASTGALPTTSCIPPTEGRPALAALPPGPRLARELRARARRQPRSQAVQLDYAYGLQFRSRTRARLVAERALALDAGNLDGQVAVIVLGFDKDVPAQAVGRLAQLMNSRPGEPSPRFHFGELLSWIGQDDEGARTSTGRPRSSIRRA